MLNLGYIELGGAGVTVRIYYDTTFTPVGDSQPLIDGPRGFCLDITNTTGQNRTVVVSGVSANPQTFTVGQGDPVTNGAGRSRTAAQMAQFGYTTRGNVGQVSLS